MTLLYIHFTIPNKYHSNKSGTIFFIDMYKNVIQTRFVDHFSDLCIKYTPRTEKDTGILSIIHFFQLAFFSGCATEPKNVHMTGQHD